LGNDNIREFRSPNFLMLRCQMTLTGDRVIVEPLVDGRNPKEIASDVVTRTTTSTRPSLLSRLHNLNISAESSIRVVCTFRKSTSPHGGHAHLGLQFNGIDIDGGGQRVTGGGPFSESGRASWEIGPVLGGFARTGRLRWESTEETGSTSHGEAISTGELTCLGIFGPADA
jgi:hypothetical protein